MVGRTIRELVQTDEQRWASDLTRSELEYILRVARNELGGGGLSRMEIAEIIRESMGNDDAKALKDLL